MKKTSLTGLLLCLSLSLSAQTSGSDYRPGVTEEGIAYFLPSTRLHITVTAERTSHTPGEYHRYAERYLRLKDVTTTPYDEWELTSVSVVPYGVADKTKVYTVKLNPKTSAPLVGLAPDGRLLSINATAPRISALSSPSVTKHEAKMLHPEDYKTEEILSAGSTAKMAELTAGEIYDIRENRGLLAKGQADFMPNDGEQLKLMLENLDKQEEALLSLFRGTSSKETHVFTFDYAPEKETEREILFRFSKHFGVVENDDLAGEPVYISIRDLKTLPEEVIDEKTAKKKAKKEIEDVRYMLPGQVAVNVFTNTRQLVNATYPMAQFGRVEHLGGELFNKTFITHITFSPETGSITKIDAEQPE